MSNNISDKQLRMSLAGQIALKLDARDGNADGQISQSVWNSYWEENNAEECKGKKENVGQNGVSVQEAFKLIMTRIFNAAKKQLNNLQDKSWNNQADKENAINNVAKEWLSQASSDKIEINDVKTGDNTDSSTTNKANLDNAYNKLKTLSLPDELKQYKIPKEEYTHALEKAYKEHSEDIPSHETKSADFASSMLLDILDEIVTQAPTLERYKVAIKEAAKLFPEDGEKIGEYDTKTLINDPKAVDKLAQKYIEFRQGNNNDTRIKMAQQALSKIKSNTKNIKLPRGVDEQKFTEKLMNYNPENVLHSFEDPDKRFSLAKINNPSEADYIAAIISDILGIDDAKENREIRSQITLRQVAIECTIAMYPKDTEDMTIRDVSIREINARAEAHKVAVEKAKNYIKKNFEHTKISNQFQTEADKKLFLDCLEKVGYDIESKGAGRSEDGVFVIETNNEILKNDTEMLVLLLHETYHTYSELKGRHHQKGTKTEEAAAEMFALLSAADIINNNPNENFPEHSRYGKKISEYKTKNDIVKNEDFEKWLNGYAKSHTGDPQECIMEAKDVILIQ